MSSHRLDERNLDHLPAPSFIITPTLTALTIPYALIRLICGSEPFNRNQIKKFRFQINCLFIPAAVTYRAYRCSRKEPCHEFAATIREKKSAVAAVPLCSLLLVVRYGNSYHSYTHCGCLRVRVNGNDDDRGFNEIIFNSWAVLWLCRALRLPLANVVVRIKSS